MRMTLLAPVLIGVCAMTASAGAMMIAPSPISQRVARADLVVLGKVAVVADKAEKAGLFKGDERHMRIVTIAVAETISGKKAKTVQVGFFPPPPPPVQPGGGIAIVRGGGYGGAQLTKDQEGVFFLTKHPTKKDAYVVQQYFDVVAKVGNPNFAAERDEARKYAKLLKDAKKNLDSKDAAVRYEAAMLLVTRYRSAPPGGTKTEAVPAGESKKLLATLAEADWGVKPVARGTVVPLSAFFLLGLQPKDGWTAPKDGTQYPSEAKKWLEANAGKYKMERYVREADAKDGTEPE